MVYDGRETFELQAECRDRGLSRDGDRDELIERLRLFGQDELPPGRNPEYERQLEIYRKKRLDCIEIIPYFNTLPPEIRIKIWEFSLPGPRMLCPGYPQDSEKDKYMRRRGLADGPFLPPDPPDPTDRAKYTQTCLFFPKDHQAPKPAALDVCRESRYIALQRYRLCFGTTNIYADLDTDILYFGPSYKGLLGNGGKLWGWIEPEISDNLIYPSSEVVADLQRVKRLGYKHTNGWVAYDEFPRPQDYHSGNGHLLRKELAPFKSLEELLLNYAPEDLSSYEEPGRVTFEYLRGWRVEPPPRTVHQRSDQDNVPPFLNSDSPQQHSNQRTDNSSRGPTVAETSSHAGISHDMDSFLKTLISRTIFSFKMRFIKPSERERPIPAVNPIVVRRVPNIPAM